MCGICGYVGINSPEILDRMCKSMIHRGPDDQGVWYDMTAEVGMAHRRLSIIDLSPAGRQPMHTADNTIYITFNGEIYDYKYHRKELENKGYRFASQTDTEVLLYLYEEYGIDFLNRINGMFALGLWDSRRRVLLLARDHAGIKPLYYWHNHGQLIFASEIKALLQVPGIDRSLNEATVTSYLSLLWVPGNETMLKSIRKIEPGHYLLWENGKVTEKKWFSLSYVANEKRTECEWVECVHDTLMKVTQRQMVSDVPLGAFLSGGIDSSSLVTFMRQAYPDREIACYTLSFEQNGRSREGFERDLPYAERVAKTLGVTLNHRMLGPQIINLLPKIVYFMDEPDADPTAILTYLIPKIAKEDGTTVLLSGTGGDEVFFGYRSHQAYRLFEQYKFVPRWLLNLLLSTCSATSSVLQGAQSPIARRTRKFRQGILKNGLDRHLSLVDWSNNDTRKSVMSPEFYDVSNYKNYTYDCLSKYFVEFSGCGDINRHTEILKQTFLAAHNFLYNDKCAMASSIEIRVPFMDVEMLKLSAEIPENLQLKNNTTKYLLKKSMERYLPSDVIYRSKTGFGPPLRDWVISLDGMINEYLSESNLRQRGIFDTDTVHKVIEENRHNKADHAYLIYAMLNLEIWMQTFIDKPGIEVSI